jgi:hypothetical protein
MKHWCLTFVLIVFGLLYANTIPEAQDNCINLIRQTRKTIELHYDTPEVIITPLANTQYSKISLRAAKSTATDGKPELPVISAWVGLPPQGDFEVLVHGNSVRMLTDVRLCVPAENGKLTAYSDSGTYPVQSFACGQAQVIRDFRVVQLNLYPVQYLTESNELKITDSFDIEIRLKDSPGDNEIPVAMTYSASFEKIYEAMICNFSQCRDAMYARPESRILIIYGEYDDAAYTAKLNEFARWKRQKGYDVDLVSTAVTGSSNTQIKSYIQDRYNDLASRPDYVIIVGDTQGTFIVPTWLENFSGNQGEGDYPYTHLAGNDLLGDAFIGRISAENLSQLNVMIAKIYHYEKTINIGGSAADWLNRMLLIGDPTSSGVSTIYINRFIREQAQRVNPDYAFIENYTGGYATTINNGINQGVGIFNYRGFGGVSGWAPSSDLINGLKLPHAVVITCGTGSFAANSPSLSEAFTRLGTEATPSGAVSCISMATNSTHTMFNNCITVGIFDGLFTYGMRSMGESLLNAKLLIKEIYGVSNDSFANAFAHWANLMGDPTLEVFVGKPGQLNLNLPSLLPRGTNLSDVIVSDNQGQPVAGACLTAYSPALQAIIGRAFTDVSGQAVLSFSGGLNDQVVVTVSAHNFKPVQIYIVPDSVGSLVYTSKYIFDDGTHGSSGNADAQINAGETIAAILEVKNTTGNTITGVNGTISCDDPQISLIDNQVEFNEILPSATSLSTDVFRFSINTACPAYAQIRLSVNLTDAANNSYEFAFHVSVNNARIGVTEYQVTAGGNSFLDPGETGNMSLTISNASISAVSDLQGELISLQDFVQVVSNHVNIGNLQAGGSLQTAQTLILRASHLLLSGMLIPMQLHVFNAQGFAQDAFFNLSIGQVSSSTPLGPDAAHYVIYDLTDTGYADSFTYDWVELCPALGGNGQMVTGLSDPGVSNDEGDQVGSDVLETIDLPFPFRFYGVNYSQITVCVNGFVVMGTTQNGDFRNYRLPGYGPSPMIAPFWDDLILTQNAAIYTYHDLPGHRFIVQYHQLRNGYDRSSIETFQVIFHDPQWYPTITMDGIIKIQYHTFNNVDLGSGGGNSFSHGNFATIGIKDHTNTIGLEYSYNNQYAQAAPPLADGSALLITTSPIITNAANLILQELIVSDPDTNGVLEPGESAELGLQLTNYGSESVSGVSIEVSSPSLYVSLENAVSVYPVIETLSSQTNILPVNITVNPDCPDREEILLYCLVTVNGMTKQYIKSLRVATPILEVSQLFINDTSGDADGIADPGENVELIINLTNVSTTAAANISLNLATASGAIDINVILDEIAQIPAGKTGQAVFPLSIHPNAINGTGVSMSLNVLGTLLDLQTYSLSLFIGDDVPRFSGKVSGAVLTDAIAPQFSTYLVASGAIISTVGTDNNYALYLQQGTHQVQAIADGYYSLSPASVMINHSDASANFFLSYLPEPQSLSYNLENGDVTLFWEQPEVCNWIVTGYTIYQKINSEVFDAIATLPPAENSFSNLLLHNGCRYQWFVKANYDQYASMPTDTVSFFVETAVNEDVHSELATSFTSVYPNPFNPHTNISFHLKEASVIKLSIYNLKGQLVKTVVSGKYTSGNHKVVWNGRDTENRSVASGLYLCRLESDGYASSRKMLLLK